MSFSVRWVEKVLSSASAAGDAGPHPAVLTTSPVRTTSLRVLQDSGRRGAARQRLDARAGQPGATGGGPDVAGPPRGGGATPDRAGGGGGAAGPVGGRGCASRLAG